MIDLRRASGTLTVVQLTRALKAFPRLTQASRAIVQDVLVAGKLQVDVAQAYAISRERVRFLCSKVLRVHVQLEAERADLTGPSLNRKKASDRRRGYNE